MAEEKIFKPQVQTWVLKVGMYCPGCETSVKKLLDSIDGVYETTTDLAEDKVTVKGNVASVHILLDKLKGAGKNSVLWPVDQNNEQKTLQKQKQQPASKAGRQKSCKVRAAAPEGNCNEAPTTRLKSSIREFMQHDNGQLRFDISSGHVIIIYKLGILKAATGNFDDANKLGHGAFGTVYKGVHDGKQIAVKRLLPDSKRGKSFVSEVKSLAKTQHRNCVKLLGYCAEQSEKLLVYEYLRKKSLDRFLLDANERKKLDWKTRYKIILGVARGLSYLHEGCPEMIVHRDIKPENILLDDHLNPKITDFGIARLFPNDQTGISTYPLGSFGYMAPEYALHGSRELFVKSDVYSFGVVLLEIVTGKMNRDYTPQSEMLLKWVWKSYLQQNIGQTIDPQIRERGIDKQASKCIHVGLLCTQADKSLRPPMSEVDAMLSIDPETLRPPTAPPFVTSDTQSRSRPSYPSALTHVSPSPSHNPLAPPCNGVASVSKPVSRKKKHRRN